MSKPVSNKIAAPIATLVYGFILGHALGGHQPNALGYAAMVFGVLLAVVVGAAS